MTRFFGFVFILGITFDVVFQARRARALTPETGEMLVSVIKKT